MEVHVDLGPEFTTDIQRQTERWVETLRDEKKLKTEVRVSTNLSQRNVAPFVPGNVESEDSFTLGGGGP